MELCLFLSKPATFALLISAEEITSALFGYGSFNQTSVKNSAFALYFFSFGLPAFALIKVFSSYIFARQNTKTPFIFSIYSVVINISLSIYYFDDLGFIIIPIATTISSWLNALMLFIFITKKKYFEFENYFIISIIKIILNSTITAFIFYKMINFFNDFLVYESQYKLVTIILLVIITFIFYILLSIITKAFKISDITLRY